MKFDTHRIRELIGDDNIELAIQTLLDHLKSSPHPDLLDQIYLQKGNWSEYKRRRMAGVEEEKELNQLRDKILLIARELDGRPEQAPEAEKIQRREPPPPPQATPAPDYVARCFFTGDLNTYFITRTNQIVLVNPATNLSNFVATRVPSMNPAFAWFYMFPNGFYYSVDHNGGVWMVNAYGIPMQIGQVQYL